MFLNKIGLNNKQLRELGNRNIEGFEGFQNETTRKITDYLLQGNFKKAYSVYENDRSYIKTFHYLKERELLMAFALKMEKEEFIALISDEMERLLIVKNKKITPKEALIYYSDCIEKFDLDNPKFNVSELTKSNPYKHLLENPDKEFYNNLEEMINEIYDSIFNDKEYLNEFNKMKDWAKEYGLIDMPPEKPKVSSASISKPKEQPATKQVTEKPKQVKVQPKPKQPKKEKPRYDVKIKQAEETPSSIKKKIEIIIPYTKDSSDGTCDLNKWYVKEGTKIQKGDLLFEYIVVNMNKTIQFLSPVEGNVSEIIKKNEDLFMMDFDVVAILNIEDNVGSIQDKSQKTEAPPKPKESKENSARDSKPKTKPPVEKPKPIKAPPKPKKPIEEQTPTEPKTKENETKIKSDTLPSIACVNCNNKLEPTAKFCTECGTKVQVSCSKCGAVPVSGSKFCTECGTKF